MDGCALKLTDLTKNMLSNSKVTVRRSISKGGDLVKSVEFEKEKIDGIEQVYVKVSLIEEFVSVGDKDLDMKVTLCLNGKKVQELSIYGTMCIRSIELSGEDYVDLSDGSVAKAQEYARGVEIYMGENVSVKLNMFQNRKYYATASQKVSSSDLDVLAQYPGIESVYTLNTVNISGGGSTVYFDLDGTYYAYSVDGVYVSALPTRVCRSPASTTSPVPRSIWAAKSPRNLKKPGPAKPPTATKRRPTSAATPMSITSTTTRAPALTVWYVLLSPRGARPGCGGCGRPQKAVRVAHRVTKRPRFL